MKKNSGIEFVSLSTLYHTNHPPHTDDGDFDVTAEMLIHDIDDETTLAEEEALRTQEEDEEELNDLQEVN